MPGCLFKERRPFSLENQTFSKVISSSIDSRYKPRGQG